MIGLIILFCGSLFLGVGIPHIADYCKRKQTQLSFEHSLHTAGLILFTLYDNNNNSFNFLLDSGSSASFINKSVVKNIDHEMLDIKDVAYGMDGIDHEIDYCKINLWDNHNCHFDLLFMIADLDASFNRLLEDNNLKISGILGNDFLESCNYVLDYKKHIVYRK